MEDDLNSAELSLNIVYGDLWRAGALTDWVGAQPQFEPRSPARLFEMAEDIGLDGRSSILDAGCGQGDHACELALRFGAHVVAMDPVESNLESVRQRVRQKNLEAQVQVQQGFLERIPFASGEFDMVWCRGVIVHLPALLPAFRECWRVLRPGGFMLLQTGFATGRLEPLEAEALRRRLGFLENSMLRPAVEDAIQAAGFTQVRSESHGSEFAEHYEKQDGRCAHHLMGIARLERAEDSVIAHFGRTTYETALGTYYWQVYQMLGKISYHAYLLEKPA